MCNRNIGEIAKSN